MKARRLRSVGLHRVKLPGHGWVTVTPGNFIRTPSGEVYEFNDTKFLGKSIDQYEIVGPIPKPPPPFTSLVVEPSGFIINTVTGKKLNTAPLDFDTASRIVSTERSLALPPMWPGETVFIIGGGPSLRGMCLDSLKDKRTIGTNMAYKYYPWVDILYFGDCHFFHTGLNAWGGLKITSCTRMLGAGWPMVKQIGRGRMGGIDTTSPGSIAWNNSTGASAINVAYWLGAKRVVLLGFDMKRADDGSKNYHKDHKEAPNHDPFARHLRTFPEVAIDAERLGLEIINATPGSAITQFPMAKLEDLV